MTGEQRLRVVIGEDSVLLLAGLVKLLESAGFEVAATAGDGDALVATVEREQPALVIADVRMPPTHTDEGIRAALTIRARWPDIAILVLSQYVEERYAADLLSTNTSSVGYLLKDRVADVTEFLDALRRVAAGGTALDPEVVAQLLVRRGGDPLDALTERERGVLALMAEGRSNAEIAAALVITDSAVSKHINSIFAKLGLYPGDAGHRRVLAVLRYLDHFGGPGDAVLASACELSMEGIVSKRVEGRYISGRGTGWTKSKCRGRDEFIVGGWTKGKNGKGLGALLVGARRDGKFVYLGRVGTGFSARVSEDLLRRLAPLKIAASPLEGRQPARTSDVVWTTPSVVVEVAYGGWTEAEGVLRHASFLGVREDKPATEITPPRMPEMAASSAGDLARRPARAARAPPWPRRSRARSRSSPGSRRAPPR